MRIGLNLPLMAILFSFAANADPAPGYDFLPLSLDADSGEFPEGIAVDRHGNFYYSLAPRGEVWRATPEGDLELLAALDSNLPADADGALGLAVAPEGVYAALMACSAGGCNETHGVWLIRNARNPVHLSGTEHIAMPNALAFGRHGELYVSDTRTGTIWVLRRRGHLHHAECGDTHQGLFTRPEIWIRHDALMGTGALGFGPLGANGLAYSRSEKVKHDEILVANTEQGTLLAIPVKPGGKAGDIEVVAHSPALFTVDGIAVDRYGDALALTVARAGPGGGLEPVSQLLHIQRDSGAIQPLLAGAPLHFSTSLTFGTRPGTEQSLFVTNWAVLAPFFSVAPEPGILRIDLEHTWSVAAE